MTDDELKLSERICRLDDSHRNLMSRVFELEGSVSSSVGKDTFCKCCGKRND